MGAGRRSFAVGVVCMLAVAVFGASAGPAAAKQRRPPAPKWDPFVERIARVVEDIRGLEFETPVTVRFVPAAQFDEQNSTASDIPKAFEREVRQAEHLGRAFGVLTADDDLISAYNQSSGGLLGYYDGAITVRGRRDSVMTQWVLSHELTHALHDQRFDTFNLEVDLEDPLALSGLAALEEGDADRVAEQWLQRLSPERRERFEREFYAGREAKNPLPEVVISQEYVPYTYGEEFAAAVIAADGQRALDRLFRRPPRDDIRLVNPLRSSGAQASARTPRLEDGEERVGRPGTNGAVALFHLLASRIDPIVALEAAGHWNADRFVQFTRDGVQCVRAGWVADADGVAILAAALGQWADAHGAATTTVDGDTVTATSCESDVTSPPKSILGADVVALTRNKVIVGSLKRDADSDGVTCAVRAYFDDGTLVPALLGADVGEARLPAMLLDLLDQRRDATTAACGFDPGAVVGLNR